MSKKEKMTIDEWEEYGRLKHCSNCNNEGFVVIDYDEDFGGDYLICDQCIYGKEIYEEGYIIDWHE